MALFIHSTDDGHVPPFEYLPAPAGAYSLGELLELDTVKQMLKKSAGDGTANTDHSYYVCMANVTIKEGEPLPCIACAPSITFEAPLASDGSLSVGDSYTVTDGKITTSNPGAFVVTRVDGKKAGSAVIGKIALM